AAGISGSRRASQRLDVLPGNAALLGRERVNTGRARITHRWETLNDQFAADLVTMVALDDAEIGVRGGLDIFKVFIKQIKTHIRRKAPSAGVKYPSNIREHIDVIILSPTELALIKVLKDLGPIVLEIANAHVQQGRRRDGAIVVHTCRVIHLVL